MRSTKQPSLHIGENFDILETVENEREMGEGCWDVSIIPELASKNKNKNQSRDIYQ